MRQDYYEPKKWPTALQAWLAFFALFFVVLASAELGWGSPPPAVVRITLIPNLSRPAVEPPPPPEPALAAKEEPSETPERLAEIVREKQEEEEEKKRKDDEEKKRKDDEEKKRKDDEEKKRKDDEEKKRKDDEEKKRKDDEEKKRKDDEEKKRKDDEEKKRKDDEAARQLADAKQKALLKGRLARIRGQIAGRIDALINRHLKMPNGVPESSDIVVVVRVLLDENGYLVGLPTVEQTSGYLDYDKEAVRAVRAAARAAPLPIPDDPFIFKNPELLKEFTDLELHIHP